MPRPHVLRPERLKQRKHLEELVDLPSAVLVRLPVAERLGEFPALRLELRHLFRHRVHVGDNFGPQDVRVAVDRREHGREEAVQAVE